MANILGPDGLPISTETLSEPQTAHYSHLQRELQTHPTRGLTPSRLASILDQAEQGDLIAQFDLFEDMEEKDGHLAAELGKRRRALLVDWSVVPPDNPTPAEKRNAELLGELVAEIADFEDVLFDITDAIGKGFSCCEIEWHKPGKYWLPKTITHRPQSWFTVHRGYRQQLRLRSNTTVDGIVGEPLQPFGWITHVHKAKSGYIERTALFRQLVWPYLFKNYSVGDLAEFLEIYGIPVRIGKYPSGASEKEKMTLLRALVGIGHNAAGIIPTGMELDFLDAATGDPKAFELMLNWCERTQSKVILGATLTSGADGKSSTNALGNVHNEVRKDLRDSDIRQLCSTVTRDLLYPMAALNGLAAEGMRRCSVFRLDVGETEDIKVFADALPKLVDIGFEIPVQWAQERVGIPQPENGEPVLQAPAPTTWQPDVAAATGRVPYTTRFRAVAAAAGQAPAVQPPASPQEAMRPRLAAAIRPRAAAWVEKIRQLVQSAASLEEIRDGITALDPDMSLDDYAAAMAEALAAAQLAGRYEVLREAGANG
jgi:phage gp29-like protein